MGRPKFWRFAPILLLAHKKSRKKMDCQNAGGGERKGICDQNIDGCVTRNVTSAFSSRLPTDGVDLLRAQNLLAREFFSSKLSAKNIWANVIWESSTSMSGILFICVYTWKQLTVMVWYMCAHAVDTPAVEGGRGICFPKISIWGLGVKSLRYVRMAYLCTSWEPSV